MLSPWQLGVPLERLRYYLLAWRPRSCSVQPPVVAHDIPTLPLHPLQLITSPPVAPPPPPYPLSSYLLPPSPSLFLPPPLIQKFHGQILDVVPAAVAEAAAAIHTRASTFTKAWDPRHFNILCVLSFVQSTKRAYITHVLCRYGGKFMKGSGSLVASGLLTNQPQTPSNSLQSRNLHPHTCIVYSDFCISFSL